MSEHGSNDKDGRPETLGRGRGRGTRADPDLPESVSSNSTKRSTEAGNANGNGNGHGNGNGNGQKRGTTREKNELAFYPTRPESAVNTKEGTSGNLIMLNANYFRLLRKDTFQFGLYRVDFVPDIELDGLRKFFVGQQREFLGGYLYDGAQMVYLTHKLQHDLVNVECVSREGNKYHLSIKDTGRTIQTTDAMATQIFNILLRRTMDGLHLQLVGRNLYDPANKVDLNAFRVELWPGYITSIRQHERDILVCTEVSHKVMRQDTIYEILRDVRRSGEAKWQEAFKKEIIGSTVLTDYNNHTYRIDDVDFSASPLSTFNKKDQVINYKTYYEQRYNRRINDPGQPMLVSNPKARDIRDGRIQPIYLVPELCRATGLTDKMRANFQMMKAMSVHTQMDPVKRCTRLQEFRRRLQLPECAAQMAAHNTAMEEELIEFQGRALPQEIMFFGEGKTAPNNDQVDWTGAMRNKAMYNCVDLRRWALIYPSRNARETEDFLECMRRVATGMRYNMGEPKTVVMANDQLGMYTRTIEELAQKDPKLIMIVVPNNAADRYSAIKRLTCVNRAIPTQVIVSKTMIPKKGDSMSIATKVMLQINSKLGGAPWMIKFPMGGTMSIGFDVTHDTTDRSKSYGAFVASMDLKKEVRYFSAVSAHRDGAEMSSNIETHMVQALKAYKELHKALPERIFFYRDGVGDGQIEYIHKQEVERLKSKLKDLYSKAGEGDMPKFSFIIVNKRLNTRIFVKKGPQRGGTHNVGNPASGTVVDNTITMPERYDFYLISQSVRQGTVAPTSYNIIHDTNGLSPDKMQILTYKQCHLYYNWSGTTRVPAVVQYAHKLAFLVGNFIHQSPNMGFNNQLYFL